MKNIFFYYKAALQCVHILLASDLDGLNKKLTREDFHVKECGAAEHTYIFRNHHGPNGSLKVYFGEQIRTPKNDCKVQTNFFWLDFVQNNFTPTFLPPYLHICILMGNCCPR